MDAARRNIRSTRRQKERLCLGDTSAAVSQAGVNDLIGRQVSSSWRHPARASRHSSLAQCGLAVDGSGNSSPSDRPDSRPFRRWHHSCLYPCGGFLQQSSNLKRDILPHDIAATLATAQLGLIAKQPRKRHVRRSAESRT
jgi:hypothetical protein